ncbi:MAG: hypothetical protein ACI4Q3_00530 [Kiritimatiellia bacterium]
MTDLDKIRALAAQRISYHGVTATLGRPMTAAEKDEYYRARTVAQLRANKDRAARASESSAPEPFSTTLTSIGAKFDLDAALEDL